MSKDLIEKLNLDYEVLLGDLWDSTRCEPTRETYKTIARNGVAAKLEILSLRKEVSKLERRLMDCDNLTQTLEDALGFAEQEARDE